MPPAAVGQFQVGETVFNGYAPLFLLGQAVGVYAGEGPDQAGFAVVDVPGRSDDDVPILQQFHHLAIRAFRRRSRAAVYIGYSRYIWQTLIRFSRESSWEKFKLDKRLLYV